MRVKLDENLGQRGAWKLRADAIDVETVASQTLCSTSDEALIEVCRAEGRCLVTLDLDFANPLRFPPARYAGIVVLRLPRRLTLSDIEQALATFAAALRERDVHGRLWIVEPHRVREHTGTGASAP